MIGQQPAVARQYFPEGGQPYPIPMPPEGSQNDPIDTGNSLYTVRSLTMKTLVAFTTKKITSNELANNITIPRYRFTERIFFFSFMFAI